MEINPLVSIVLPTFNRVNWLKKSIRSVLEQNYTNWELLVIDDASSDGTTETMLEYEKLDKRIFYHKIPVTKELGISKFLNFGINNSKGKYIARLDDDDQWCDKDKLAKQVDFLESNPDYVLVGGGVILIDENGNEIYRYFENETDEAIREKALYANPISHPSVLFRKDTAQKIGGYSQLEFAEDWDFWLRLGKEGKMYNFKEYFSFYLMSQHNNSLRNQKGLAKAILKLIKNYKDYYPNYKKGYLINYFQFIHSYLPQSFRRSSTNYLKYIKRKYF